jgi:hypothetical protein
LARMAKQFMALTILCARHGPSASVLACEHVCAAVSLGTEPPVYRRLGVTVDHGSTAAYCACFACANQYELASEIRASRGAEAEACKFPKSDPICTKCLEQTHSPPVADLSAVGIESVHIRARTSARPIQVTAAVLLLCVWLVIDLVPPPRSFVGILMYALSAWLTYSIWMGRYWARGVYAVFCGLSIGLSVLWGGINVLHTLIDLVTLYLLFVGPGRAWFEAESPTQ